MEKIPTEVCGKCKKVKDLCNCGRESVMTPETIAKLEQAFAMGCTDKEACIFADISPSTLYNYQNQTSEFLERKAMLKMSPILKARKTLLDNLEDPKIAMWYLERRLPQEFNRNIIPPQLPDRPEHPITDRVAEELRALEEDDEI